MPYLEHAQQGPHPYVSHSTVASSSSDCVDTRGQAWRLSCIAGVTDLQTFVDQQQGQGCVSKVQGRRGVDMHGAE